MSIYIYEPVDAKVIKDFFPPPEELAFREEGEKVALCRVESPFFQYFKRLP
jgi:hypothetical protein